MRFCPYCGGSLEDCNVEKCCPLCGRELPEELVSQHNQESRTCPPPEHASVDTCEEGCAALEEESATSDEAAASPEDDGEGVLEDEEPFDEPFCSDNPFLGDMDIYEQRLAHAKAIINHGFSNLRRKNSPDSAQDRSNACNDFRQAAEDLLLARSELCVNLTRYGVLYLLNAKKGKHNVFVLETSKPSLSQYIDYHYDNALLSEEEYHLASVVRANGNAGSHYDEVEQGRRKTIAYRDAKRAGISAQRLLTLSAPDQLLETLDPRELEAQACDIRNTLVRFYLDTSSVEDLRARLQRKADGNALDAEGYELLQKCDDIINQHRAVANDSIEWLNERGYGDLVEEAVRENNARICNSICEKLDREISFIDRKAGFIERRRTAYESKRDFINRNQDNNNRAAEVNRARGELQVLEDQIEEAKQELRDAIQPWYDEVSKLEEMGDARGRSYRAELDRYWQVATIEISQEENGCFELVFKAIALGVLVLFLASCTGVI